MKNPELSNHVKAIAAYYMMEKAKELLSEPDNPVDVEKFKSSYYTYWSTQATEYAVCHECKHTPIRNDKMGGYVCLTCIDRELERLQKLNEKPSE